MSLRFVTGLAVLLSTASAAADVMLETQTRTVEALVANGGTDESFIAAPDFGPFNENATSWYYDPYCASAAQQSTISEYSMTASGSVSINNAWYAPDFVRYYARSSFEVTFLLTGTYDFALTSEFGGFWDVGGWNVDQGLFELDFSGPGGVILQESVPSPNPGDPAGAYDPPLEFGASGELEPGTYSLSIMYQDELLAQEYEVGGGGIGSFSLELDIIPEPGGLCLVAAGAIPILLCRRRRSTS